MLGSSWRTEISLPEGHPAYHMWHELSDRRKTFTIEKFDSSEIFQQLQQLSNYLEQPLEKQLKKRLIEHCSGLPWLLKKLCIHIYRQVKKGIKTFSFYSKIERIFFYLKVRFNSPHPSDSLSEELNNLL